MRTRQCKKRFDEGTARQRLGSSGHWDMDPAVPGLHRHVRKTGGAGEASAYDATHLELMCSRRVLSVVWICDCCFCSW